MVHKRSNTIMEIQTKYSIGDKFYYNSGDEITEVLITGIEIFVGRKGQTENYAYKIKGERKNRIFTLPECNSMWFVNCAFVDDSGFGFTLAENSHKFQYTYMQFFVSGLLSVVLFVYCFTLPECNSLWFDSENECALYHTHTKHSYLKEQNPKVLILCRINSYYVAYDDDATVLSKVFGIVKVSQAIKDKTIETASIQAAAIDDYLAKLVSAGYKVALCEGKAKH